jgi:hypothetical protein
VVLGANTPMRSLMRRYNFIRHSLTISSPPASEEEATDQQKVRRLGNLSRNYVILGFKPTPVMRLMIWRYNFVGHLLTPSSPPVNGQPSLRSHDEVQQIESPDTECASDGREVKIRVP